MATWLGVDDTDSVSGMCTTYLATEFLRATPFDLIGFPRLVRLNPNVPWKTRGNAAVCLRLGRGSGRPYLVGGFGESPLLAYPHGTPVRAQEAMADAFAFVEELAQFEDPKTNPGIYATVHRPPASFYRAAVTRIVPLASARKAARGGELRGFGNQRGIVGAVAATAWRPRDRTYEVVSYRSPDRWGTPRHVEPRSVKEMEAAFPETFNSFDSTTGRSIIAPHSPCPVLFGIRGDRPERLPEAMRTIRGEAPERWLLFETNQGTDDHVLWRAPSPVPRTTVAATGTVASPPRMLPGGHAVFRISGRWTMDCTIYEPAKRFRDVALALHPGDRVTAIGSIRASPRTLNVEKLLIRRLVAVTQKVANPVCACGKRMKSAGRGHGYRCRHCGSTAPATAATFVTVPRRVSIGWYEPPVGARRHLSKPLKRMALPKAGPQAVVEMISMPPGRT